MRKWRNRFDPVIIPHNPFFFEMGLRYAESWGNPEAPEAHVGGWMYTRKAATTGQTSPESRWVAAFGGHDTADPVHLWTIQGGFDIDHHCLGYTHLLAVGVNGLLAEIDTRRTVPCTTSETANLDAMARSCRVVLRVAERFGEKARSLLGTTEDPQVRRFLGMISEATAQIPAQAPRTFYEGLAMLWFLREVTATLEGIGISVLGHIDRLLIDLYRADLAAGRLTETEACDLLARWMLPTDIKFHVEDNAWPETSTCLELGGCDADGNLVWNELTRLIIKVHRDHRLMNPKLNCRIAPDSPPAYLTLASACILDGHNHLALLNDAVLIPAFIKAGKTESEARLYVNGGCQEPIVEGVEHSAGAYFYYNMARTLDLCLRQIERLPDSFPQETILALPQVIDAETFEEFYLNFLGELQRTIRIGAEWSGVRGRAHWQRHPCPFFSTTLQGCIINAMDYTQGGAKYNPSGIALVGLGTVIDALYALRIAVYEERWVNLTQLRAALDANWNGFSSLRTRIMRLPRFGHGDPTVDALAARFAEEIGSFVQTVPSERGGVFQGSFFVYYTFLAMGKHVRATPDGRLDGEVLTQGIAPNRYTAPKSLTDVFYSLNRIDFTAFPGNAVLDVQLPAGNTIPTESLAAVIRTFAKLGGPTLQLNCVSVETLKDAQRHPERHRDLAVRISGLSAHFVCLTSEVQDEIISRALLAI